MGYYFIEEVNCINLDELMGEGMSGYFDYEAYGRDLTHGDVTLSSEGMYFGADIDNSFYHDTDDIPDEYKLFSSVEEKGIEYLKNTELGTEENYNNIDGVRNNLKPEPTAEEQDDSYSIYQLKKDESTRDYRFMGLDDLKNAGLEVNAENYDHVYTAPCDKNTDLNDIYHELNYNRPADFTGHSMSMSDVVVLALAGEETAHYVDRIGFKELSEFTQKVKKTLRPEERTSTLAALKEKKEVVAKTDHTADAPKNKSTDLEH